jgi:ubiquinone/menaquinone biosynthesis C-methylase UbiE
VDPSVVSEMFDRAAETYDVAVFPFFTPFGEALVEFAAIGPDDRVLDVGCGAGAALAPAARVAKSAVGVEISPAMAERARAAAPTAEVRVGDAQALDFDDGSFDVVLSSFVIFFMPDPTATLREWGRVLAPGGRLVLATWAEGDPRWAFERELRRRYASQLNPEFLKGMAKELALLERFTSGPKVTAELEAAGFLVEEQTDHVIEFVFPDVEALWEWNMSHGVRVFLEAFPDDAREQFRADLTEAMQQVRESRGYPRTFTSVFTTSRH